MGGLEVVVGWWVVSRERRQLGDWKRCSAEKRAGDVTNANKFNEGHKPSNANIFNEWWSDVKNRNWARSEPGVAVKLTKVTREHKSGAK